MKEKNDRRSLRTREAIFTAFNELLTEKNYAKISIQDIVDRANIGRSTFYAHFDTKDDLLEALCTDLFGHIFSRHLATERTHDFSAAPSDPQKMLCHILYHLRDNGPVIKGLLAGESSALFTRSFKLYMEQLIEDYLLQGQRFAHPDIPGDFLTNHIAGSFLEMVRWWIRHDWQPSPEELMGYYRAVVLKAL